MDVSKIFSALLDMPLRGVCLAVCLSAAFVYRVDTAIGRRTDDGRADIQNCYSNTARQCADDNTT